MLSTPFTLAALWADLARLAGEPLPADVAAVLDAPVPLAPEFPRGNTSVVPALEQFTQVNPLPCRGSYADHRSQFPELYAIPRGDLTITEIMARCPHPTRR